MAVTYRFDCTQKNLLFLVEKLTDVTRSLKTLQRSLEIKEKRHSIDPEMKILARSLNKKTLEDPYES